MIKLLTKKNGLIDMNCLTVTTYLVDAKFATFTPIDSVIDHALDVQYMHPSYRTPQIMALLAYLV